MIRGALEIREAYRDETVAQQYVDRRFTEPLFALLHERQVQSVLHVLDRVRPRRILELAPGPARVTLDVAEARDVGGVILDASRQMLVEANRRLNRHRARWSAVQGDAFALPVNGPFELAYSFRFIRHFDADDRRRVYREIARVLAPGGWFIFDAVNAAVSAPLRAAAPDEYKHFDALMKEDELYSELSAEGFVIERLEGVQRRFGTLSRIQTLVAPRSRTLARALMQGVSAMGGAPLEWIVVCRRR